MLRSYIGIYQIALKLENLRATAELLRASKSEPSPHGFSMFVEALEKECLEHGFTHTADLARRLRSKQPPKQYGDLFAVLDYLDDSLSHELEDEAIFPIPPERKSYFECKELFGAEVATAYPSCASDIEKAGSCYALGQGDACVHHLMLVLERGLHALAAKVGVLYQRVNWQTVINEITSKLNTLPRGHPERDFYRELNTQFGLLKDAYRNHSEHAHDDPYDMDKARHILNHVRDFMQALVKGGVSE